MCSRSVQPENARWAMAVSVCGSVTSARFVQSRNMPSLTRVIPSASTAVRRSRHALNRFLPDVRIVAGTVILVRCEPANASSPTVVTPAGMVMPVTPLTAKASLPMVVIPSGMVTVSMPQLKNRPSSSVVMLCGSVMFLSA